MRKIKFRAWDTELKQYVYEFNYNNYDISDYDGYIYITKRIENSGETPLLEMEQFTGLHDKNGKEIYEGDIVREEMQNGIDYISIVVYDATSFYFYNARNDIESYVHSSNCAVIGNIHENKDLLEGGN